MLKWNRAIALAALLLMVSCQSATREEAEDRVAAPPRDGAARIAALSEEMARLGGTQAFVGHFFREGTVEGAWVTGQDLIAVVHRPGGGLEGHLVDLVTGRTRWMVELGDRPLRFAPEAGDRHVVFVFEQGGGMVVINRANGARNYTMRALLDVVPAGPAASSESTVYMSSLVDDKLWSMDPATGQRGWFHRTEGRIVDGPCATPRLPRRMVVIGTDAGEVVGIPAAAWDEPTPAGDSVWLERVLGPVTARPTIAAATSDGRLRVSVLVPCEDNGLYCLNAASGSVEWVYRTAKDFDGRAQSAGDRVFARNLDRFCVIDLASGADAWKRAPDGELPHRYETARGVYAADASRAYLDLGENHVLRVSGRDGKEQAEAVLGSFDWVLPATDANLLVGLTKDGFLVAYR